MVGYIKTHIVNGWIDRKLIEEEDRELYEYGIEITVEFIVNIITTIILALITREIIPCIFMYGSFMVLRSYSGGIHAKTFIRCYFYSTLVILVTLIFIRFGLVNIWVYRGFALVNLVYLWRTEPVESENKVVNEREKVVFRHKEKIVMSVILFISVIAIFSGFVKIEKGLESTLIVAGISSVVCFFKRGINFEVKRGVGTNMIRIAICDDEEIFSNEIENIVVRMQENLQQRILIKKFTNAKSLLFAMEQNAGFDILFMDIELENENGIEIVERIKNKYFGLIVIYVTSHQEYVYDIFKTEPLDFIRKPFNEERIKECMLRALDKCYNLDYLKVRYKSGFLHIKIKDIMYIYSERKKLHICMTNGEEQVVYGRLDYIEEELNRYDEFIRIQKSYLVNFNFVKRYDFLQIVLQDGKILSVSRDKKEEVREKYFKWKI